MINAPLLGDKKWTKEEKKKREKMMEREWKGRLRKWDRKSKQREDKGDRDERLAAK